MSGITITDDRGNQQHVSANFISNLSRNSQLVFCHATALVNNISIVTLYFISVNGFIKHLSEAVYFPASLQDNVTAFTDPPLQYPIFGVLVVGSGLLFITNQFSMPSRIRDMFGLNKEIIESNSHGRKYIIGGLSVGSAIWKTLVSSSSLLALTSASLRLGFYPGLVITLLTFWGNFAAQATNFLQPFSQTLGCCRLPNLVHKFFAGGLTLGFTLSDMALYFNTIDQGFMRNGWMEFRLLQIPSLPIKISINVAHVILNLIFGWKTFECYKGRIYNLLSIPRDEEQSLMIERHSFWQQISKWGIVAAGYKTTANFMALLNIMALCYSLEDFDGWQGKLKIGGIAVTFGLQVLNFISQLTFFSETKSKKTGITGWLSSCTSCFWSSKQLAEPSERVALNPVLVSIVRFRF